ncbi:MAG TPA: hypothetical protein VEZ16_01420 [Microvirga sp.]|nr:hypothetical protein [Microvirga sp.]
MLTSAYPRGFVIPSRACNPPEGFSPGPVFENFFVAPECPVDSASIDDVAVVVLGTCVSTDSEARGPAWQVSWMERLLRRDRPLRHDVAPRKPAEHMLRALLAGEADFFDLIDRYCGRHVILFQKEGRLRILTDATGMRTVFYAVGGGVVASHAQLVEETPGDEIKRTAFPFAYGFPGNHTPYLRTRLLTPNTLYDFAQSETIRFWPRRRIGFRTAAGAAAACAEWVTTALRAVAKLHPISLSLTAGLDSRTTLAVAVHSGVPFNAYTYDRGSKTDIDCAVAAELARRARVRHVVVGSDNDDPDCPKRAMSRASYYNHHQSTVASMRRHFGRSGALAVTAKLLEIGRYFYQGAGYDSVSAPETPEGMCELYLKALSPSGRAAIERYGMERYRAAAIGYFSDFIRDTAFNQARGILDPRDQFYWEYRMAAWHGVILLERDFYADCFIPFSSRRVFEALLGVRPSQRKAAAAFRKMIMTCAPELLDGIPINPPEWPVGSTA